MFFLTYMDLKTSRLQLSLMTWDGYLRTDHNDMDFTWRCHKMQDIEHRELKKLYLWAFAAGVCRGCRSAVPLKPQWQGCAWWTLWLLVPSRCRKLLWSWSLRRPDIPSCSMKANSTRFCREELASHIYGRNHSCMPVQWLFCNVSVVQDATIKERFI